MSTKNKSREAIYFFENINLHQSRSSIKKALESYKNHRDIIIFLDSEAVKIDSDFLPLIEKFWINNNIEKFLRSKIASQDTFAYYYHEKILSHDRIAEKTGGEVNQVKENVAQIQYASISYEDDLYGFWLNMLLETNIKLQEVFFFAVEVHNVFKSLFPEHDLTKEDQYVIFLSFTKSSGIILYAFWGDKIQIKKNVALTEINGSLEYLEGLLEQEISDIALQLNKQKPQNINLFILVPEILHDAIKNAKFNVNAKFELVIPSDKDAIKTISSNQVKEIINTANLLDADLTQACLKNRKHKAINDNLRTANKLRLINSWIFKPFALGILYLLYSVFRIFISIKGAQADLKSVDQSYYLMVRKYNQMLKEAKNPYAVYALELQELEQFKRKKPELPFEIVSLIFQLDDSVMIEKLTWQSSKDPFQNKIYTSEPIIKIDLTLEKFTQELDVLKKELNNYLEKIKALPNIKKAEVDNNSLRIVDYSDKKMIYAQITITLVSKNA